MVIRRAEAWDCAAVLRLAQAFATSFAVEQAAFERSFAEILTHSEAFLSLQNKTEKSRAIYSASGI